MARRRARAKLYRNVGNGVWVRAVEESMNAAGFGGYSTEYGEYGLADFLRVRTHQLRLRLRQPARIWETRAKEKLGSQKRAEPSAIIDSIQEKASGYADATNKFKPQQGVDEKRYKMRLGQNIHRLRLECGWGFNELADATGLDKKLIIGHENKGKGAHPSTLKIYATAFTKKLERTVTVAELTG